MSKKTYNYDELTSKKKLVMRTSRSNSRFRQVISIE